MNESIHFQEMMEERGIQRDWAKQAIECPDRVEDHDDGTSHYIKQIPEFENRWLRVVVNTRNMPEKIVTAFFDRRLRRKQ